MTKTVGLGLASGFLVAVLVVPGVASEGSYYVGLGQDGEERSVEQVPTPGPQIYNGDDVPNPGWVVAILEHGLYRCTGALIRPDWVITAGHCVEKTDDAWRISIGGEEWSAQPWVEISEVHLHPSYDSDSVFSVDLAVIKLGQSVATKSLASLPAPTMSHTIGQALAVFGWGDTGSGIPDLLQGTTLSAGSDSSGAVDESRCWRPWVQESGYDDFCIGGEASWTSCPGDSGSPVVGFASPDASSGPMDTVYGVTSFAETTVVCDSQIWDAIAQSTGPHVGWIEEVLSGVFTDDDGSVFEADIEWIAAAGITKGCNPPTNDKFCPDSYVTRGQMAAFLVRAMGYSDDGGGNLFVDDNDSIFEADIDRLATAGVTKGCNPPDNTKYCPDSYVTRGQMAAFLVRAMGYTEDGGGDLFIDDDDSIFEADIDHLATAGVTRGCNPPDNTRFCPGNYVTRGQMAAFLHRALG